MTTETVGRFTLVVASVLFACGVVVLSGCFGLQDNGSTVDAGEPVCDPGAVEECFCVEGEGTKRCAHTGPLRRRDT